MCLDFRAQMSDVIGVVFRFRLFIRRADCRRAGVGRQPQHGVRIERLAGSSEAASLLRLFLGAPARLFVAPPLLLLARAILQPLALLFVLSFLLPAPLVFVLPLAARRLLLRALALGTLG